MSSPSPTNSIVLTSRSNLPQNSGPSAQALGPFLKAKETAMKSNDTLFRLECVQPFRTRAEALAYLNHEKLECLICGKHLAGLGNHLYMAHGITARSYKTKLRLPLMRGLCGTSLISIHKTNSKYKAEMGIVPSPIEKRQPKNTQSSYKDLMYKEIKPLRSIPLKFSKEIIKAVRSAKGTQREIAQRFNMSEGHVCDVLQRKRRKYE